LITRLHPRSVSHGRVGAGSYERSICIRRSAANGISIRTRGAAGVYDAAAAGRRVARAGGLKSASSSPHISPAQPASSRRHHRPEHKEVACVPTLRCYPCMSRLEMCGMATQRKNQGRNGRGGAHQMAGTWPAVWSAALGHTHLMCVAIERTKSMYILYQSWSTDGLW